MKKACLVFWCVVCLLCLSILSNLPWDRYFKVVNGAEMTALAGVPDGDSLVLENGTAFEAGLLASTGKLRLEKGDYRVIFRYTTMAPGSAVALHSAGSVNPDNSLGVTLAAAELGYPGYGEQILELSLPQDIGDLEVQALYGGDNAFMVHSVSIVSAGLLYTDTFFVALLMLLFALWIYSTFLHRPLALGESLQGRLYAYAPVFLVIGLGLLVSYPLFNDTLTTGHDYLFHSTRLEGIAAAWRDGQFPPRVNPIALGYKGYASSLMYPDILMWPAAALRLLGLSFVGSYRLVCIAANFASAALSYLVGQRLFRSRWAGAVTAVLYTFAQYRLYNVYLRDALGEAIAMAVFPLVVWGLYEVFFGDAKKWPVLMLGVTLVFQSHIITIFLALLFCGLAFVVFLPHLVRNRERFLPLCKAAGLTVLLNLWFIVPMVGMMQEDMTVTVMKSGFYNLLSSITELFYDAEYSLYNSPGALLFLAGALFLAALLALRKDEGTAHARRLGAASLCFGVLFIFLASTLAPWHILDYVPFISANIARIQFPQRFFAMVCIFFALCGGAAAALLHPKGRRSKLGALFLLVVVCFSSSSGLINSSLDHPDARRSEPPVWHTWELGHIGYLEYLYNGYDLDVLLRLNQITSDGALTVSGYEKNGTRIDFAYTAEGAGYIDLPLLYYPGYRVTDEDGNWLAYTISPETFIRVENPPAAGSIHTRYTGLWWWRISDGVSLVTLLACIGWAVWNKRRAKAIKAQRA